VSTFEKHLLWHLRYIRKVFALVTADGLLDSSCAELLETEYSEQFQTVAPSSVPTIEQLRDVRHSTLADTGNVERSYQTLRRFIGLQVWPRILIISNSETLSNDQALCLRGCLSEQESDKHRDWPRSIIFIVKKDKGLNKNLIDFVRVTMIQQA
jgi:hypothetical protein